MEELQPLQGTNFVRNDQNVPYIRCADSPLWIRRKNVSTWPMLENQCEELHISLKNVHVVPNSVIDESEFSEERQITQQCGEIVLGEQERINVSWRNLSYVVPTHSRKEGDKVILKNLSGEVKAGQLTAIMGPSGAGKSTLLNILTGFVTRHVSGEILVNNKTRDLQHFRRLSCYILQDDLTLPYMTVYEAVMFAANLKLPSNIPKHQKKALVLSIIETLGLAECMNTRGGCLSGGQKKRLSIAQELVNNPPVIFLDEPTSGIDSVSCIKCIQLLKSLSHNGRNIVCTIHQPNMHIFEQFDKLYMLANGLCIYKGATKDLIPFLSTKGLNCPTYCNPAEFITEIASGVHGHYLEKLLDSENARCDSGSVKNKSFFAWICAIMSFCCQMPTFHSGGYITGSLNQFLLILQRTFLSMCRDPLVTHLRFVTHVIVGILIGLLYFEVGNDANRVYNNCGLLFFSQLMLLFTAMMPTLLTFPLEMSIFVKEHLNCWYSSKMYYLAKTAVDLPFQIVFPVIYISIMYWMTDQPSDLFRFFLVLLFSVLVSLVAQSVGLLIGALGGIKVSIFLGPVSVIPPLLFSGYFVTLSSIPSYLKFMTYLSYMRFSLEGTMQTIYGFNRTHLKCSKNVCIFTKPDDFLEEMDMADADIYVDIAVLASFFLFLRILGYFALQIKLALRF